MRPGPLVPPAPAPAAGAATLGGIENMAALTCPCCATRIDVFPPVAPERSVWAAL